MSALGRRQTRPACSRPIAGDDRHFEEQRYYRAYPGLRNPKAVRRNGFVLMALGVVGIGIAIVA